MAHDFHNHGNLCYNVIRKGGGVPLSYKKAIVELVGKIHNEKTSRGYTNSFCIYTPHMGLAVEKTVSLFRCRLSV